MMTERYSNHATLIDFNDARLKLEKKLRTEERKRKGKEAEQKPDTMPDAKPDLTITPATGKVG